MFDDLIYLRLSHNFIRLSYEPDKNWCSLVLDQATLDTQPACEVYVHFTIEPSEIQTIKTCKDITQNMKMYTTGIW